MDFDGAPLNADEAKEITAAVKRGLLEQNVRLALESAYNSIRHAAEEGKRKVWFSGQVDTLEEASKILREEGGFVVSSTLPTLEPNTKKITIAW